MKCHILFAEKNKKNISKCRLLEILPRVLNVKQLTSTCAHSFARKRHLPFFNQWKGENDHRKYFVINLQDRMLPQQFD